MVAKWAYGDAWTGTDGACSTDGASESGEAFPDGYSARNPVRSPGTPVGGPSPDNGTCLDSFGDKEAETESGHSDAMDIPVEGRIVDNSIGIVVVAAVVVGSRVAVVVDENSSATFCQEPKQASLSGEQTCPQSQAFLTQNQSEGRW